MVALRTRTNPFEVKISKIVKSPYYQSNGGALMATAGEERLAIEIDAGGRTRAVTFSGNGNHLFSAGHDGIRIWKVEDGQHMATMKASGIWCLAGSKDGKWIAAGALLGDIFMWNAETHEQIFKHRESNAEVITALDFSPDSTRLVSASNNRIAIVRDVATRQVVQEFGHNDSVIAAKYSPDGDRIATATPDSVRVWDGNDGNLLMDLPVKVTSLYNRSLWFGHDLFVISDDSVKRIEASTRSAISKLRIPRVDNSTRSCFALPHHGEFVAYATNDTIMFLDGSTNAQLALIQHPEEISSIAYSPDDQFLAVAGENGKIIIQDLGNGLPSPYSTAPFIDITETTLHSWKQGRLADTEASLTQGLSDSTNQSHHIFANRALVRCRLHRWDQAIDDANESIKIQPTAIGYIAKSVALIGGGQKDDGYRAFDLAFRHCDPVHTDYLLLIKAVVFFTAGKYDNAVSRVNDLIAAAQFHPIYHMVQAYMYLLLGDLHMERGDYEDAIRLFESAQAQSHYRVRHHLLISLISGWSFDDLSIAIGKRLCEALYAAGRTGDTGRSLLELVLTINYTSKSIAEWVSELTRRCLSTSGTFGDTTHTNVQLLKVWAKVTLENGSWENALITAASFVVPRSMIYQVICERLETIDRIIDASECFRHMVVELVEKTNATQDDQPDWVLDFRRRCSEKLERLGDMATNGERHNDAINHYSAALALNPTALHSVFIKRSKAYLAEGLWEAALDDAKKAIEFDSMSPWGYERMHAALHKAGDYGNAINAFKTMLSKMSRSSDPEIREHYCRYIDPGKTKLAIQGAVRDAIRHSPRVLINTTSGRLLNKSEQASAFESLPVFNRLISSMMTRIDLDQIKQDVSQYYRYAMFSHKWEEDEPLFERVIRIVVYDLEESPTHHKLQMFCKIVRDSGLHWAWSDTCCINKADHFILQEALVSMFKWYQGSAVTFVLLRGVPSPSRRGDLVKSIWNSRAWTFQEYHASKVVRFYNEDWTLYMSLDIPNHKQSPEILAEMEKATGISVRALTALQPGLDDIREKLCLASTRQTTLIEDAAYSLLGIFSISLPVVYGEGDQALGRLLSQLLTSSGDTSILAWAGNSGSFNSCLPGSITVFKQLATSYIPTPLTSVEMDTITARLRNSLPNLTLVAKFYDQLNELRVPTFSGKRMTLPCIVFKLGPLSISRNSLERVFRAQTAALGTVEIRTEDDLTRFNPLYLVHPWIDFLLDRQPVGSVSLETIPEEDEEDPSSSIGELPALPSRSTSSTVSTASRSRTARIASRFGLLFSRRSTLLSDDTASLRPPSSLSPTDKQTRALCVLARLRQPFGALLLTPSRNVAAYRRVATETLIRVRVEEITPIVMNKLIDSVDALDVL